MSRKASGDFDQIKYQNQWIKENTKPISGRYKAEFVDEFKAACKKLGITQSDVIRKAMEETIKEANK